MLYYLFEYLDKTYDVPGAGLFNFITFRAILAVILSLFIATVYGKKIINYLQKKQVGESIRDLGLEGQNEKAGTPTMGGIIIILATLVPVLLFAKLENIYVILLIVTTVWMGTIGFIDDYIKKFKNDKQGLPGKFKVIGQIGLGLFVGVTMYLHPDIIVQRTIENPETETQITEVIAKESTNTFYVKDKAMLTTIPFVKENEFNYSELISWAGENYKSYVWLIFIPIVIFIITAVSNGA
ncbi:MAG: phospho-N-acetylmuramoyl-pentapeptide-transferase, partial [Aequorivita vladivostokensis]|nr:phospho-N-acetylmuramoyl-pentapeptide-transferase [Aequorivita vladivostokensis]